MTRTDILRRSLVSVSLLALTACATPYPTRYSSGLTAGAPSQGVLAVGCDAAIKDPSRRDDVKSCLVARGAGWERRAAVSRRLTRNAGAFSVLAAAVGIGLAAQGDPNHAIVPLGLAAGAAVAGANNFASPEQASVSEKAVAAYNCLLSAVAEWSGGDNIEAIRTAHGQLKTAIGRADGVYASGALSGFSAEGASRLMAARAAQEAALEAAANGAKKKADRTRMRELLATLKADGARFDDAVARIASVREGLDATSSTAEIAFAQITSQAGMPGARLLRQSDEIDRVAIGEITRRELTATSMASTARQTILSVAEQIQGAGAAEPEDEAAMSADARAAAMTADTICRDPGKLADWCGVVSEWGDRADRAKADADRAAQLGAEVKRYADSFDAAVKAHKATDATLGQGCIVAVTEVAPLTTSATTVTLDDLRTGSVVLRGGVGGYFAEKPPAGWTVTLSPSGRKAARVDIKAPAGAKGTHTLTFYDGDESSFASVDVKVAEAAPAAGGAAGEGGVNTNPVVDGPGVTPPPAEPA